MGLMYNVDAVIRVSCAWIGSSDFLNIGEDVWNILLKVYRQR